VVAVGSDLLGDNDIGAVAGALVDIAAVADELPTISSKASLSGATFTGPVAVPAGASGSEAGQVQEVAPAGEVRWFARNTAPTGFLKANGALVSRTTYAALFASIGTTFGAGDGSTTFALPDMRGEFPRGWDDGRGVDSGRAFGSAQGDAIRDITGTFVTWVGTGWGGAFSSGGTLAGTRPAGASNTAQRHNFDASAVVPTASENRPRSIALLACIKF
jgi:phage-related tail fiber protein